MAVFDPSQFGATPVTPSSGFNPADFGATPVDAGSPSAAPSNAAPAPSGNKVLNAANSTAGFLGIQKFGQGIATAGRVASGSINQTGDEEAQMAKDQQMVINQIHTLRAQGVPNNDLKILQLTNFLKQNQGNQKRQPKPR